MTNQPQNNSSQNNPSRWADDESGDSFVPFCTPAEAAKEDQNKLEADVLKIICSAFNLDIRPIRQATYQETGEYRLGIAGFQQMVYPPFPAKLTIAKPFRGKGEVFTLNRLLKNPNKFALIADFLTRKQNLKSALRPVMLIGLHPRIKQYVAITDLLLEPDLLCFNVLIEETGKLQQTQITFGEFSRILSAMKNQGLWTPELTL
jgi:hypothetical protein